MITCILDGCIGRKNSFWRLSASDDVCGMKKRSLTVRFICSTLCPNKETPWSNQNNGVNGNRRPLTFFIDGNRWIK